MLIARNKDQLRDNGFNYGLYHFAFGRFLDEQLSFADYFTVRREPNREPIRLEFLYKQRIKFGEVMSTLPIGKFQLSQCLWLL